MEIPQLSQEEIDGGLREARKSSRHRYAKILHKPGDEFNHAFNFLLTDTYMQPHHHPSEEKVENIYVIEGKIAVLYFDDNGNAIKSIILEPEKNSSIEVPAFTWHTYVVLSDYAITYETMMGVYDPKTWKTFGEEWAPPENTPEASIYLEKLKAAAVR